MHGTNVKIKKEKCLSRIQDHSVCIQLNPNDEVIMAPPLSGQAGFQFLNTIRCSWHTWPAHLLDLAVPDCFLWGSIKSKICRTHLPMQMTENRKLMDVFKGPLN